MRFGPPYNTRQSATVEHLLALSLGGTWAVDNLRLCHKGCNRHLGIEKPEQKEKTRSAIPRNERNRISNK
jgi:5-methylcytosine-specific restriction endonuclease McrA